VPYGEGFKAPYATTKKIAELAVLAANDPTLATVALRPRLIWGVGDNQLLPRLVERANAGRLRFVGDGENRVDTTYIDNAAQAHFDAFEHLAPGAACAGRAYFISNGEPRTMRETINALLGAVGAPLVHKTIPFGVAYAAGVVCEGLWHALPLKGEPPMTRFLAEQLATTHWYDMAPARRDFGLCRAFDEGWRGLAATARAERRWGRGDGPPAAAARSGTPNTPSIRCAPGGRWRRARWKPHSTALALDHTARACARYGRRVVRIAAPPAQVRVWRPPQLTAGRRHAEPPDLAVRATPGGSLSAAERCDDRPVGKLHRGDADLRRHRSSPAVST
jgi:hypothetical protein